MSSITWWNRLEPRPRSRDLGHSLAACVRDPAWFLARQWQFGEFHAEDAASPAFVQVTQSVAPVVGWRVTGQAASVLPGGQPLEETVETEAFTPDLALRVELGQTFDELLRAAGGSQTAIQSFRTAYSFTGIGPQSGMIEGDPEGARFSRVCAARALDGYRVYQALLNAAPAYPNPVGSLSVADAAAARTALDQLKVWIEELYDAVGQEDASAWRPERFEYDLEVVATNPAGNNTVLGAYAGREASFDWFAFDEHTSASDPTAPGAVTTKSMSVIPAHVRFRGMPNHRFWDFESGQVNFGGIEADTRDLARLIVADFFLVQANDWFLMPMEQPVGTLSHVDALVVHDVFGGRTLVERADRDPAPPSERWTMFSTASDGTTTGVADYFILPPSAAGAAQMSAPIEAVHMLRDQMANMAWAVEHETENSVGLAWPGHEREIVKQPEPTPPSSNPSTEAPLRWKIQTPVPAHWIPLVPVSVDPLSGDIALLPGAMIRVGSGGLPQPSAPIGRILKPGVQIAEAEVSRVGTRVTRAVCCSRWTDGSTHLWIARRKSAGGGEGSSGLTFDLAELRHAPP